MKQLFYSFFFLLAANSFITAQTSMEQLSNTQLADTISYLGGTKQCEEGIPFAQELLKRRRADKSDTVIINSLNRLGILYTCVGEFDLSEDILLEALEATKKNYSENSEQYAGVLTNLGNLYQTMNQYEKAEPLFVEVLRLIVQHKSKEDYTYLSALNSLAVIYKNTKRPAKAEAAYLEGKTILESLKDPRPILYTTLLNNLAVFYKQEDKLAEAEKLYLQIITYQKKSQNSNTPQLATSYTNLGALYRAMKQYPKSEKALLQAYTLNPKNSLLLNNLASFYLSSEVYNKEKAANYIIAALDLNSTDIDSSTTLSNAFIEKLPQYKFKNMDYLFNSLGLLNNLYYTEYKKTNNLNSLQSAYLVIQAQIKITAQNRQAFTLESSKLRLLSNSIATFARAINLNLLLAQQQNTPQLQEEAFGFFEQNKSILLSGAIQNKRALSFGNLPEAVAKTEYQLQDQLEQIKKLQTEAKDSLSKIKLVQRTNLLNLQVDSFQKVLKNQYPKYYQLKYSNATVTASEMQKLLPKNTALIEYFVADTTIYVLSLTNTQLKIHTSPINKRDFKNKIDLLFESLSNYTFIQENAATAYQQYTENAHFFYNILLKTALQDLKGIEHLIIVPDNLLSYLPFEAFLVEPAPANTQDYSKLHYLLQDVQISYSYSASLLQENYQTTNQNTNGQFLAIAANYTVPNDDILKTRSNRNQRLRQGLLDLPAARQEVEKLHQLLGGKLLVDKDANEANFKQLASNYGIIHLAMHGLLDIQNPILSSLAFTENGDTSQDNFLQSHEIAKLQLNASLIVLSACETGYGKFEQGEGVLSLGRSFMYAGAPSLVMSLWSVNDQSTSIVMEQFYKELKNGKNKAEALRLAKLHYIKTVTGIATHPAFWSPFIQLGDSRPINIDTDSILSILWWVIGGISFVGMAILIVLRLKRPQ